jgi:hypothetical protein
VWQPPEDVQFILEDALELLIALEEACEIVRMTDHLSVLVQIENQLLTLTDKLGFEQGDLDAD